MAITVRVLGDDRVSQKFHRMPDLARRQLTNSMQRIWFDLQRYIVEEKLSGQVLHRRTGLLASSITAGGPQSDTKFEVTSFAITGHVGTKVVYAAIHEYGGVIVPRNAQALHFRIGDRDIFTQRVTIPERSFLRSSIEENRARYISAMKVAVNEFVEAANV